MPSDPDPCFPGEGEEGQGEGCGAGGGGHGGGALLRVAHAEEPHCADHALLRRAGLRGHQRASLPAGEPHFMLHGLVHRFC